MSRIDDLLLELGLIRASPGISVPAGHDAFFGHESGDTEGSQSFSVSNGLPLDQRTSFVVGSVIVDNNTSAWINIPDATKDGTGRFVGPGQGASFPILGHISRARINWIAPPGKIQPIPIAGEQAQVIFLASAVPPGFGFAAPVPTLRWNVNAFPGVGAQASATRAAAPGITHIGDSLLMRYVNTNAAIATVISGSVIDGPSGGTAFLLITEFAIEAETGDRDFIALGPGLNYKGTPGNPMTIEFGGGGGNNTQEVVSMAGLDQ